MSRRVLTVSATQPGCYPTIGKALAEAASGSIINIRPGTYRETLVLTVPVTITADERRGSVIVQPSTGPALVMGTEAATLSGVVLRNEDAERPAVDVGVGRLRLDDCEILARSSAAVFLRNSAELVMRDCRIENPSGAGIVAIENASGLIEQTTLEQIGGSAIVMRSGANPTIRDCTITDARGNGVCGTDNARGTVQGCTISNTGSPAVAVEKQSTTQVLECTIRDTSDVGIFVTSSARPTITDCEISDTAGHGLLVGEGADPQVKGCRISRTRGNAIQVTGRSRGTYTGCVISAIPVSAIWVGGASDPVFTACKISECDDAAVTVTDRAAGTFEELEIREVRQHGVTISAGANPLLRKLSVTDCHGHGIVVVEEGRGRVEDSEVADTHYAGMRTASGGNPEVRNSKFRGSADAGVLIGAQGRGAFKNCDIAGARMSGVLVEGDGDVSITETQIHDCEGAGVQVNAGGVGWLTDCEIFANSGDGVLVHTDQPLTLKACTVRDNAGSGLRQTVPNPRMTVEELTSRDNAKQDAYGTQSSTSAAPAKSSKKGTAREKPEPEEAVSIDVLLGELESLVGLAGVKQEVAMLVNLQQLAQRRRDAGLPAPPMARHLIFAGPPGTGKTTVARLYGRILASLGTLRQGHVVEVAQADLVANIVGGTAIKTTEKFESALGGLLFVDEAYTLTTEGAGGFGREAIDTLVKLMEDHRDDVVVIAAGYSHEMRKFLAANPGLASRFTRTIEFDNYDNAELVTIVEIFCRTHHYTMEYGTRQALEAYFERLPKDETFGNGRTARKVFEEMIGLQAQRLAAAPSATAKDLTTLLPEDVGVVVGGGVGAGARKSNQATVTDLRAKLDGMVGLASVKREVGNMVNLLASARRREAAGLPAPSLSRHLIFSGAPGTGKTTVARLYGELLTALGVLQTGQLIEVARGDLVGEYVGHTAKRTKDAFDRARGGVLFIDEAYTLASGGQSSTDFGREAIDTLVKLMEDHRDEVVVIAAGYTDDMERFLEVNAGLASRFSHRVEFENYQPDELVTILGHHAATSGYTCAPETHDQLLAHFQSVKRGRAFGNGRYARQVLDTMITRQAGRLALHEDPSTEELRALLPDDLGQS